MISRRRESSMIAVKRVMGCAAGLAVFAAAAFGQDAATVKPQADARHTPAVEIFQRYKDAVVYLTGPMAGPGEPATEEFFALSRRREVTSLGSGFVVHESGYILANAHTVLKPFFHQASLANGQRLPAELLAVMREHDLALLKVEAKRPLTAVKLARSGDLLIGEPVIVIGNPRGLRLTCTAGVLSAIRRVTKLAGLPSTAISAVIQTDAAINPGSSGGPWFNALGEVIGITSFQSRDSENIGFGIPVETIRQDLPEMLDVERRQGIVTGLEIRTDEPCKVAAVAADSPAAKAGVRVGDVLVKLDGKAVAGKLDYCLGLIGRKPRETLKLELLREGKPVEVLLVLGEHAKPDGAAILKAKFGLTAAPLDKAKAEATSLRIRRGVVVTEVAQGAPWNYDKLPSPPLPGDVLARIDNIRPRDLDDVGLLLDRIPAKKKIVMVFLRRTGNVVTRVDLTTKAP
jgi:serine protease Do